MLNQPSNRFREPEQIAKGLLLLAIFRLTACMIPLVGICLLPPCLYAEAAKDVPAPSPPRLVNARQGDTPASIAQRYLGDASKAWMIEEYNDSKTLSDGEAILVPVAPFRRGGLTPDGYQTIPVLAYAGLGAASDNKQQVSRSAFSQQMRWLRTEGFTTITPMQLVPFMELTGQLPRRSVLITFDTTSQRLYDIAIPILKEHGFTATLFLTTDDVGSKGNMSWDQIKRLQDEGFTIACRGRSGRSLTRRTDGQAFKAYFKSVESELVMAREAIETHLGTACRFLAYPHGQTNRLVSAMVAKMGFLAAFNLQPGANPFFTDRFGIHRTVIDSRTSPEQFGKKVSTRVKAALN